MRPMRGNLDQYDRLDRGFDKATKAEKGVIGAAVGFGCLYMVLYLLFFAVCIWGIVMLVLHFT